MSHYVIGRFLAIAPVLLVVSLLAFGLEALTPGDPAVLLLHAQGVQGITPSMLAAKHAELHLDQPLPVRYLDWLGAAVHGDFGRSFRSYTPVRTLVVQRFGNSLLLAACTVLVATGIGVPLGTLAGYHRGGFVDGLVRCLAAGAAAVPGFWLALVLLLVFSVLLHWLPAFGTPTPRGIILPTAVLAFGLLSVPVRLTRAVIVDVLGQEFVIVARAKGLASSTLLRRHVLPNAVVPVLTVLGLDAAYLMTGAAVVEFVFGWPGLGKMAVDAALLRDMPVVVGFAVTAGLIFVTVNLLVDLTIATIDPRVRSV